MEQNYKPLDPNRLRQLIQQESARMNLRSFSTDGESSFTLALALSAAIKKIFFEKSETTFSNEPQLEKKFLTQFRYKMRVDAMEKFNDTTVFAALQYAADEAGLQRQAYMVTLIVYLEQEFLPEFLRLMQYPYFDSDNEMECKDGCGTLVNLIGGQYKRELSMLGYKDFMMAPFQSFINVAPDGVGIPKGLAEKYELSFEVDGTKRLVVEMVTLDMLPKWKTREERLPKKILIIDDDLMFIKIIRPFLQSQGFEVIIAFDGVEGIRKLKMNPHVIILDISMPVMNGYQFVLEKKKIEGAVTTPVIVLTSNENMEEVFKVEGAREYLVKPFQPAALLKSIQRCI